MKVIVRRLFIMTLVLFAYVARAAEIWRFLPCFHNDVRGIEAHNVADGHFFDAIPEAARRLLEGGALKNEERREFHWHTVAFPHRDFMRLMPEERVFGWYGCEFDVPKSLAGMDVLADLGIIDDSDETFVNGSRIAVTGQVPNGSAWQTDRLYRIPAGQLETARNYMAVHVWSLWGLGGIVGPPVLKAALLPRDAQWDVAFVDDRNVPKDGLNAAGTLEKAMSLFPNAKSLEWRKEAMPWKGYGRWNDGEHYAVFKVAFELKEDGDGVRMFGSPVVVDMGPVFDVAAIFLNGRRLCLTGRFPEKGGAAFTEAAQRARFIAPPDAWSREGRNELAAIVYRERGTGGLPSLPGILLENPLETGRPSFAQLSDSYNILLQSGDMKAAGKVLRKMRPKSDNEKAWLLSHKAHLAFLEWLDAGAKKQKLLDKTMEPVVEIVRKMPKESPKQSAMQAFCSVLRMAERDEAVMKVVKKRMPSFRGRVEYVGEDSVTKGDWPLNYGRRGYSLAAMGQLMDISSPTAEYRLRLPVDDDSPRLWLDLTLRNVASPDALLVPKGAYDAFAAMERVDFMSVGEYLASGQKYRRASWWDDHGEMHPFDDNGPDFLLDWLGDSSRRRIALYFLDFDWRRTLHPRQHSVIVFDGKGKIQDAMWLGKICDGTYHLFETVSEKTTFRVQKHRSACTCLSGVFCDNADFGKCPDGLPQHIASLASRILELEKRNMAHSEFDSLRAAFRSIDSIDEAKAFSLALDGMGIDTSRWRMMLLARVFELLDGAEGDALENAVQLISDCIPLPIAGGNVADVVLLNYLKKRGVPA
ncbi:MAG: hypothetical protein J5833_05895, partial [Victivallales bacterium]|nr:hypothetical protein [Victivallales bacterium]